MPRRIFQGFVTKTGSANTITVRITDQVMHPKYKKYITRYKSYLAHDEKSTSKVGDSVKIIECRPISKQKKWQVVEEAQVKQ